MICDIINIALSTPPQKERVSFLTTTSSLVSSSHSSFKSQQISKLQIPKPSLSQYVNLKHYCAHLVSYNFKLLMPDEGSIINQKLLTQELIEMRFILDQDQDQNQIYSQLQPFDQNLDILEQNILNDDRTTLMLKNIPKYMKPNDLRNLLTKDFQSQFDFLYLTSNNNKECNLGYAFFNFIYPEKVLIFFKKYIIVQYLNSLNLHLLLIFLNQNYFYILIVEKSDEKLK